MKRFLAIPVLGISLLAAGAGWANPAPNLVVNGGFETGDFTGWTSGEAASVGCNNGLQHSGNCEAELLSPEAHIIQTIPTTPGATYTLNFWNLGYIRDMLVYWNGNVVYSYTGGDGGYVAYTEENVPNLTATGSSSTLEFLCKDHDAGLYVDDISLTADTIPVSIIIKPGASPPPATINMKSNGKTPVAILSTASWSAPANVDTSTLTFGATGTEQSYAGVCTSQDVNGDGIPDLVCNFTTQAMNFLPTNTSGTLDANTLGGIPLTGTGPVRIIN